MPQVVFYFFISCITILMANCSPALTPEECKEIKDGKYMIHSEPSGHVTVLTRVGKTQSEFLVGGTDTIFYGVRWQGDCEYELHHIFGTNPLAPDSLRDQAKAHPIHIKILEVQKEYYTFRAEINRQVRIELDTAFRVE